MSGFATPKDRARIQLLDKQLKDNPRNYKALLEKAILCFDPCYLTEEAVELFKQLIEQDPQNVDAYFWYGECLFSLVGDYLEAERILRIALTLNPNRADCLMLLASILCVENGRDEEIISLFTKAMYLEPTWLSSRRFFIGYLVGKRRFAEAKRLVMETLPLIPDTIPITDDAILEHYETLVTGRWCKDSKAVFTNLLQRIDQEEAAKST